MLNVRLRPIADIWSPAKLRAMKGLHPTAMATWLGLAYAGVVILFLLRGADGPLVALGSLIYLPWFVGPAGVAAYVAKRSTTKGGAWAFFILDMLIIGSTIWLWIDLTVAPDAQSGIAIMLFPLFQFAAVFVFFVLALGLGWRSRPAEMRSGHRR
jgi:hypothetical protein